MIKNSFLPKSVLNGGLQTLILTFTLYPRTDFFFFFKLHEYLAVKQRSSLSPLFTVHEEILRIHLVQLCNFKSLRKYISEN